MKATEEQRQETLLALLQHQELHTSSQSIAHEHFHCLVHLLIKAMKSQWVSELQVLQDKTPGLRSHFNQSNGWSLR
ncbi:hypothetical protein ACFFLM_00655 [Deinococcus oregonensis]|uniref:Uncharacterized protein n=1 Tax=Deinococcus oregonensis TaxID=1805970 RepID=A0ABV6ASM3_9DEIO